MIVIRTLEFIITAALYITNTNIIIGLVSERKQHNKLVYILLLPYLASSVLMSLFRDGRNPLVYLCATLLFYLLLYLIIILQYKSSKSTAAYVSLMFLSIDSIVQTLGCIILGLVSHSFNQDIVLKTSSLIFNIVAFIIIKRTQGNHKNQIRNSIKLLPKRVYLLVLISLFVIGHLCGNMAQTGDAPFSNDLNSLLTSLTVLIFLVMIIWFVFSSISKQYYESISKVMEKQVDEQVSYYQKINKLSEDIREFRHDYKNHMICLQALLEGKEYADALEYVRDITKQDIIESNKFFSGNQIADAILSDKAELAKQFGCKIEFDGFISDEIPASDLCIILSNALDNAIEACTRFTSNESKIITVKCDILHGIQLIRITNPNDINNSTTETSKEDKENHGFGLYNIRRTVEKHNGQMSIPSQTPRFILDLEFQIK